MRYVIDGSNLLGGPQGGREAALRLMAAIDRLCVHEGHSALVLFDGLEGHAPGTTFRFAPRVTALVAPGRTGGQRADREILALARRAPGSTLVVTDDVALASAVRRAGSRTLGVGAFVRRLAASIPEGDEKEAARVDDAELLRAWTTPDPPET